MRFHEFTGEWETKKLGEICRMRAGKFVSASEISDKQNDNLFPCYGGNGLRGYTKSFNQNGIFSLIGRQGALCGNVTLANGKFHATEHAVVVTANKNIDTIWIFYLMTSLNLNQYATGMAQPGLSVQNLEKIEAILPKNKTEQIKIAAFLTLIDKRIETQNKIIEKLESLIKGLENLLFCDRKSKPALRFPEYLESWRKSALKEFTSRVTRKNKDNETQRALTIAAQYGLVDQMSFFNKQVASNDMSNYYFLYNGEFAYNKSYSKDYPWGAVKRLDLHEKGALSTLYICFKPENNVSSDYLAHYFESNKWHQAISEIAGEGARNHGLLNISIDAYFNTMHYIPSYEEQNKIASFLNLLCMRLENEKSTLYTFEKQKLYFFKQMFI